ncbi:MAG TPA: heavy-metal-associated domain-containing protein [Syntrophorhabdaceae bacterium]|nr:heavy-metal-associated domain-containing protein [Syntrophorhabdaceae bacterium]HOD74739.1 heavy-metal-associated domain-containing protein [Syntrophorhabdaceae bacterium]
MAEAKLKIDGMSCQHCVMAVKKALGAVAGVDSSDVDIGSAVVRYDEGKASQKDLEAAVEKAGFSVKH